MVNIELDDFYFLYRLLRKEIRNNISERGKLAFKSVQYENLKLEDEARLRFLKTEIKRLDERLGRIEPEIERLNPELIQEENEIDWRM